MDDFLEVASGFDWITPTFAFIRDMFNDGPVSDFGIPATAGWGRKDIKRILTNRGIRVWGLMFTLNGDTLMFTVPAAQAKWAYFVLEQEGIPILYAPADVVEATQHSATKSNGAGYLDSVFNFIDELDIGF